MIQDLRHKTDAGVLDCRQALKESGGDMAKAIDWLQKKGAARAVKKTDRDTGYGVLLGCVPTEHPGLAAVVQLCAETDFAVKSERFSLLAEELRQKVNTQLGTLSTAGQLATPKSQVMLPDSTLSAVLQEMVKEDVVSIASRMGENVRIKAVWLLPAPDFASNPKIPEAMRPKPVCGPGGQAAIVVGSYAHNAPAGAPMVGSTIGLTSLWRLETPATLDAAQVAFAALPNTDPAVVAAANDVSQHIVSVGGEVEKLTHQSLLGSAETVGKFMQRHRFALRSTLFLKFGMNEAIVSL